MEEILRVRVKHLLSAKDINGFKRQKLDLRKLDMNELMAPYGQVEQYRLNTPYSAFVKFSNSQDAKKAKLGLNHKKYDNETCFGSLHVDIVKRDTFSRADKDFGPKNAQTGVGFAKIKGLVVIENYIDEDTEKGLIDYFETSHSAWENPPDDEDATKKPVTADDIPSQPTRRRVQHYGYKFDYTTRRGDTDNPLDNWPPIIEPIRTKVDTSVRDALNNRFEWKSDQATVNEYVRGEGIAKHIDTHSAFEDGIASVSVGSDCVFRFAPGDDDAEDKVIEVVIPKRSVFIMTGDSRYYFTHQMPQRNSDKIDNKIVYRGTRYSITFRQIKNTPCSCQYKTLCE
mmetsp:Transcript_5582/g.7068  ORF Transcript_5582/g.7068 Transcript_5582/m.7068 type:complete len:341 (+) Transcript_5582:95-1117(+)